MKSTILQKSFLKLTLVLLSAAALHFACTRSDGPRLHYTVSFPDPASNSYDVSLHISKWKQDSIVLKLPNWTPGYYQIMDFSDGLKDLIAEKEDGSEVHPEKLNHNSWKISGIKNEDLELSYTIHTQRKFVANSWVDEEHAYLVPGNSFLYPEGYIKEAALVKIELYPEWDQIATGLQVYGEESAIFSAPDLDILYDCPILTGNLEELPSFEVDGIQHHFTGYKIGDFDHEVFMEKVEKVVRAAVEIIGDIPYKEYTFIAIGPGMGGIEHMNNTTVSFDGNRLESPERMTGMLSFLAHEYFHHYNVKRIRPFELGPFDYERGSRTNQLWICEGLTVYYEGQILHRAGLIDSGSLLSRYMRSINTLEVDPGRHHQSLAQASYQTWEEGPFGRGVSSQDQSISVYNKGEVLGILLDLKIRYATNNKRSLDNVMRRLYFEYYKQKQRGFTEAEFQLICEEVAGIPLIGIFEYVYTTKEINYSEYLEPAGIIVTAEHTDVNRRSLTLEIHKEPDTLQAAILKSWLGVY